MHFSLRPFTERDFDLLPQLVHSSVPFDVESNQGWVRNRMSFDSGRFARRHYAVVDDESGSVAGYAGIEQGRDAKRFRLFIVAHPYLLRDGLGEAVYPQLEQDAAALGARVLWAREYVNDTELLTFLKNNGFAQVHLLWDLRLDLAGADLSPFQECVEAVASSGIDITSLADERGRDADCVRKMQEIYNEVTVGRGIAESEPVSYEAFAWQLEQPSTISECTFIAREGEKYVGYSSAIRSAENPRRIVHGWTGVRSDYRRRGLAMALKVHSIHYAQTHGYESIVAYNDESCPEVLALNERLGFVKRFGFVTLEKELR